MTQTHIFTSRYPTFSGWDDLEREEQMAAAYGRPFGQPAGGASHLSRQGVSAKGAHRAQGRGR